MDIPAAERRRLLADGRIHSVQLIKNSFMLTLPKETAEEAGVSKQTDLPIYPSEQDDVLFEIGYPEDSDPDSTV